MIRSLRLAMVLGGSLAFLLHLALGLEGGRPAIVALYLSLPAMVWLQRKPAAPWAAGAFAFVLGFCLVDQALALAAGP